jgi:hypothetical protein
MGADRPPWGAVRAICLLALVSAVYVLVAWGTQAGFYDGFAPPPPPQPYRWISPPPQSAAVTQPPVSAHQTVTVQPGVLTIGVGTSDRQAQLLFQPGTFAGSGPVEVDVEPARRFPGVSGFEPSTNVYLIRSSVPLVKPATVRLLFSELSRTGRLYRAGYPGGTWQVVGAPDSQGLPYFQGPTSSLPAYFVGGSPVARSPRRSPSSFPMLQVLVAAGVVLALVAALPLVLARRHSLGRRGEGPGGDRTD